MKDIMELGKEISKKIHTLYYQEMDDLISNNDLTGHETFDLIIDICIRTTFSIFHSLPVFFPEVKFTKEQTDDIRKEIIDFLESNLVGLENASQIPITSEQIKEIEEKGFAMVELPNGETKRIEQKDILITKQDVGKLKNFKTLN
jgi:hypothetical protein